MELGKENIFNNYNELKNYIDYMFVKGFNNENLDNKLVGFVSDVYSTELVFNYSKIDDKNKIKESRKKRNLMHDKASSTKKYSEFKKWRYVDLHFTSKNDIKIIDKIIRFCEAILRIDKNIEHCFVVGHFCENDKKHINPHLHFLIQYKNNVDNSFVEHLNILFNELNSKTEFNKKIKKKKLIKYLEKKIISKYINCE